MIKGTSRSFIDFLKGQTAKKCQVGISGRPKNCIENLIHLQHIFSDTNTNTEEGMKCHAMKKTKG